MPRSSALPGARAAGIGQPVTRKEDRRLLGGGGRFTDDLVLPAQAHVVMVRSPHAHARLRGVNAAPALCVPGVLLVLSGADVLRDGLAPIPHGADVAGRMDVKLENRDGSPRRATPHHLLPLEKTRFVGEVVAAVVAETLHAAIEAAELVEIDYEPLPAVTGSRDALQPGAPLVWEECPGNTGVDGDFGDRAAADEAFARASHVAKISTWIQRVTSVPMEPRAALCAVDAASGRLTMYCGADNIVRRKRDLAAIFALPEESVRVVAGDVGGNFGTRNWFYPEYGIVAWAARRLGRNVRWTATRSEALLSDYQGRDLYAEAELALDRDGKFLALRASLASNIGAHTVSYTPLNKGSELLTTVYHFPAAYVRARGVLSNTAPTAPYRSAGRPEAMLIMETLIEAAARDFNMDALELRRRNLVPEKAMPYLTPLGLTYDSGAYARALERVLELADWRGFSGRRLEAAKRGRLRGIGLANYIEVTSGAPRERAEITVFPEGGVEVVIGTTSSGQGHETSFTQCVSEWLGVPFDCVRLLTGDTDRVKEGGGSHSARSMRAASIVMAQGTAMIIDKATAIAAHVFEVAPADIEFSQGTLRVKGTDRAMTLFEIAAAAGTRPDLPEGLKGDLQGIGDHLLSVPAFPYGAQVCEIEIDPETGVIELASVVAVDDVGRAVNPMILHGQTHGGIAQGYGQALYEQCHYDPETGQMLSGSMMDYAIARAADLPSFVADIMEVPSPANALGVRGGGEGGTTPALAAAVNAIVDALSGYGIRDIQMPATPQRIWRLIQGASMNG